VLTGRQSYTRVREASGKWDEAADVMPNWGGRMASKFISLYHASLKVTANSLNASVHSEQTTS